MLNANAANDSRPLSATQTDDKPFNLLMPVPIDGGHVGTTPCQLNVVTNYAVNKEFTQWL